MISLTLVLARPRTASSLDEHIAISVEEEMEYGGRGCASERRWWPVKARQSEGGTS